MKKLNGKQIKSQRKRYIETQRNKVWEQPTIKALKEYAKSINGFYELYVDYSDDLSDWIVEQYNYWNGKGSFRDVISEEIWNWELDNEYYVMDDIHNDIMLGIDDEILEKYEDEINDYLIDYRYDYFSVGYDWDDFPCEVDVYMSGTTDCINEDIASSEVFSEYLTNNHCISSESNLYWYLTEFNKDYQTQKDEISGLNEIIDFIEDCTEKDIDFDFNSDDWSYLLDSSDVDSVNEITELFNNNTLVIDWETKELKEYESLEDLCKTIKVPFHSIYEDRETVCIESKEGFQYHLEYDEISKITSTKEHKREVVNDVLSQLAKRKVDSINMSSIDTSKVWISFNDSLASGNCKFGTNEFCRKHNIDTNKIGGIRADYLLDMEYSSFTTRAVKYKYVKMVA